MEDNELIAHIEKYERHPLVIRILKQETTFEEEVEKFYDLQMYEHYGRGGRYRRFDIGDESIQKIESYPTDLVEILNDFKEQPLKMDKLRYDLVREDQKRWNNPSRETTRSSFLLGGILAGVGGAMACTIAVHSGQTGLAGLYGLIGASGFAVQYNAGFYYPDPKGTNFELEEFCKLHSAASSADYFIEEDYVPYFMGKVLAGRK